MSLVKCECGNNEFELKIEQIFISNIGVYEEEEDFDPYIVEVYGLKNGDRYFDTSNGVESEVITSIICNSCKKAQSVENVAITDLD